MMIFVIVQFDAGRMNFLLAGHVFSVSSGLHDHVSGRRTGGLLCGPALFFRSFTVPESFTYACHVHIGVHCRQHDRRRNIIFSARILRLR